MSKIIQNVHKYKSGGLAATFKEDVSQYEVYQDETPFLEQAKLDRAAVAKRDVGYKKACTIPDIVAIEILNKYGIDVHHQLFMHDEDLVKKVLYIMRTEYAHLMSY